MGKGIKYSVVTFIISILVGIMLHLGFGVRDPTLIAIAFSLVWFIYVSGMFLDTFLIRPGLKRKASRRNGLTEVRYELRGPWKDAGCEVFKGPKSYSLKIKLRHFLIPFVVLRLARYSRTQEFKVPGSFLH